LRLGLLCHLHLSGYRSLRRRLDIAFHRFPRSFMGAITATDQQACRRKNGKNPGPNAVSTTLCRPSPTDPVSIF